MLLKLKGGAERSGCVREGSARERQYEWPGRKNARCIFSHSLWQALLSEIRQAGRKNRTQTRVVSPVCAARCLWVIADLAWYAVHCAIVEREEGERERRRGYDNVSSARLFPLLLHSSLPYACTWRTARTPHDLNDVAASRCWAVDAQNISWTVPVLSAVLFAICTMLKMSLHSTAFYKSGVTLTCPIPVKQLFCQELVCHLCIIVEPLFGQSIDESTYYSCIHFGWKFL